MCARRFSLVSLIVGLLLFGSGVGMRVYASLTLVEAEQRLIAARPASPAALRVNRVNRATVTPADGPPSQIRLPDLGLWNTLEPVMPQIAWQNGDIVAEWEVRDAGWHRPSGWPGHGRNVVISGHSPARNAGVWSRSVFRQLAYLKAGERIELTAGHHVYTYRVNRVFAIPEQDTHSADATAWLDPGDSERITLITCWPPQTAAYRVLVIADPVNSLEINSHE